MKKLVLPSIFVAVLLIPNLAIAQKDESRREIKHITGDLYNIQDDMNTFTAFLLTPEGIILTDPISSTTANWIKAEFDQRFDVPVKYIVYSHYHDDHAPGAEVFEDATIIAHEPIQALLMYITAAAASKDRCRAILVKICHENSVVYKG